MNAFSSIWSQSTEFQAILRNIKHHILPMGVLGAAPVVKAHLIASKLKLHDFDTWVQSELNGYSYGDKDKIPNYRKVKGTLKAFNPYRGWISAQCSDDKTEK